MFSRIGDEEGAISDPDDALATNLMSKIFGSHQVLTLLTTTITIVLTITILM